MKLIIDIPDKAIKTTNIANDTLAYLECCTPRLLDMLRNGIPLPKGHGRLVDADYLLNILKCEEYETCTWRNCQDCNNTRCIRENDILKAQTIIEADKSGSEE